MKIKININEILADLNKHRRIPAELILANQLMDRIHDDQILHNLENRKNAPEILFLPPLSARSQIKAQSSHD